MKTILVTGGAGFIGSHLVDRLLGCGHHVVVMDVLNYAGRRAHLPAEESDRFRFKHASITVRAMVRDVLKEHCPEVVFHLAAETHVGRSVGGAHADFMHTNVMGTFTLIDECLEYWRELSTAGREEFRFIHVSTDEVYGSLNLGDPPWLTKSPYDPRNPYAASKAASDHLITSWNRTWGLPTILIHSANNYGTRQHVEKLIPNVIARARMGLPIEIHGDGMNVRDWLHVNDHVNGLISAWHLGVPGETYNLMGSCQRSVLHVISLLLSKLRGRSYVREGRAWTAPDFFELRFVSDRPGNDRRYDMLGVKALQELNWKPGFDIESRIEPIVDWYLENGEDVRVG